MKILAIHNYYQYRGGEDESFESECALLESNGQSIIRYTRHNAEIASMAPLRVALCTVWNGAAFREVNEIIARNRPDVVHCNNTFPLISAAVYYAAARNNVPVVQAVRNYRFACLSGLLQREGRPCEVCMGRIPWRGVWHACYRNSRRASVAVLMMLLIHRSLRTYQRKVDLYLAVSATVRQKMLESGFGPGQVVVKPNFLLEDPDNETERDKYFLFVGYLSKHKGIRVVLECWGLLKEAVPLKIVGDGPLAEEVKAAASHNPSITFLGRLPHAQVLELFKKARCLIYASLWYEGLPRVIMEALGCGTPVIASRLGASVEMIEDRVNGLLYEAGAADEMAKHVSRMAVDDDLWMRMRQGARLFYEKNYTATRNMSLMMKAYEEAIGRQKAKSTGG